MRGRIRSRTTLAVVVLALVVGGGCGGGGGGGGGGDEQAGGATSTPAGTTARTPTPTAGAATPVETAVSLTPGPTATPGGGTTPGPSGSAAGTTPAPSATPAPVATTVRVDFTVTSVDSLLGFQFTAVYPTAAGSFSGSGAHVQCPLGPSGIFVKNDQDDGHLILAAIDLSPFPHAFNISCMFDVTAGQTLTPGDIGITGTEVTRPDGTMGDPSAFAVAVGGF